MGGRGAWSKTLSRAPYYRSPSIRRSKVSDYLLNPKKSKGRQQWFASLGYNMRNHARLQEDLKGGLRSNRARITEKNSYGTIHVQVNMEIGVNRKELVVTGWIVRDGSTTIELETVRPYHGKKDDF